MRHTPLREDPPILLRSLYSTAAATLAQVRDRALPQACFACGDFGPDAICAPCVADMPVLPRERCPSCQLAAANSQLCGRCLKKPPHWRRLTALLPYEFPLDRVLVAAKYQHAFSLYRWAAAQCAAWPFAHDALLLPVPLAPARLQSRGFNQAQLIAQELARRFALEVAADAVIRIRETEVQQGLDWIGRRRNVRGAFSATRSLAGRAVVLVDDVLTTGATLNALADAAIEAGAGQVDAFVLARVQPMRRQQRSNAVGRAIA